MKEKENDLAERANGFNKYMQNQPKSRLDDQIINKHMEEQ